MQSRPNGYNENVKQIAIQAFSDTTKDKMDKIWEEKSANPYRVYTSKRTVTGWALVMTLALHRTKMFPESVSRCGGNKDTIFCCYV